MNIGTAANAAEANIRNSIKYVNLTEHTIFYGKIMDRRDIYILQRNVGCCLRGFFQLCKFFSGYFRIAKNFQ